MISYVIYIYNTGAGNCSANEENKNKSIVVSFGLKGCTEWHVMDTFRYDFNVPKVDTTF